MKAAFFRGVRACLVAALGGGYAGLLQAAPGGTVYFSNKVPIAGINAPVFDVDGVTPLEGPRFVVQLWAGVAPDELQPVNDPVPFREGKAAGYFVAPGGTVVIPQVAPGATAYLEARAWDRAAGETFAEAWAAGGPAGRSPGFSVVTGGEGIPPSLPANLVGLESFHLQVLREMPPQFLAQPESLTARSGQPVTLSVRVMRPEEASFQWEKDGVPIPGATEPRLVFPVVRPEDAGAYRVVVSNAWGETVSEPAVLAVTAPGGTVYFANKMPIAGIDAPVFDVDGVTPLAGPQFVAQLWGGPNPDSLAPVGAAVAFRTGEQAGYWDFKDGFRVIDSVPAGETAWLQVVAWEAAFGDSFASARQEGGRFGSSPLFSVATGGGGMPPALPANLTGLESFALQPGVQPPTFLQQPEGGVFFAGMPLVLEAEFTGEPPLSAQWLKDGAPIPGATGARLAFPALTEADSGTYVLTVQGPLTERRAEPAVVRVFPLPAGPGGTLWFANHLPAAHLNAPVFFMSGQTRVSGDAYVAQLWVGLQPDALETAGKPAPFGTGPEAGYWLAGEGLGVSLPKVTPGEPVFVQVVVWPAAEPDFETAREHGKAVGFSDLFEVATGGTAEQPNPAPLTGLTSIRLGALPKLVSTPTGGKFYAGHILRLAVQTQSYDPVTCQWRKDGVDLPGQTNETLVIESLRETDSGTYVLRASNRIGTRETPPVEVEVVAVPGVVLLQNRILNPNQWLDAAVLLEDEWTPASGTNFWARLYAGRSEADLQPVGPAVHFGTGWNAGYFAQGVPVTLPGINEGEMVFVQVRAWEGNYPDYESALAAGVRIGASQVLELRAGSDRSPAWLRGLESFTLQPQHPVFVHQPPSLTLVAGEDAAFAVSVAGTQAPRFQWERQTEAEGEWVAIPGATNTLYVLAAVTREMDGWSFRVIVDDPRGSLVSDPAQLLVAPVKPLGEREGAFELRLAAGAGPRYTIEFSPDLFHWEALTTLESTEPVLSLQEHPDTRAASKTRFYRARDTATGKVASKNIAGFLRLLLRPGLNLMGVPLVMPDDRIAAIFADAPAGTIVYVFDPESGEWIIDGYEFGEWYLPELRLPLMGGCFLLLSEDTAYELTLAGDVPTGRHECLLPEGWSLHSTPLPVAGALDRNFFLPLQLMDAVAFWDAASWSINVYLFTNDGWPNGPPIAQPGEAFWVFRHVPTVWSVIYDPPLGGQ